MRAALDCGSLMTPIVPVRQDRRGGPDPAGAPRRSRWPRRGGVRRARRHGRRRSGVAAPSRRRATVDATITLVIDLLGGQAVSLRSPCCSAVAAEGRLRGLDQPCRRSSWPAYAAHGTSARRPCGTALSHHGRSAHLLGGAGGTGPTSRYDDVVVHGHRQHDLLAGAALPSGEDLVHSPAPSTHLDVHGHLCDRRGLGLPPCERPGPAVSRRIAATHGSATSGHLSGAPSRTCARVADLVADDAGLAGVATPRTRRGRRPCTRSRPGCWTRSTLSSRRARRDHVVPGRTSGAMPVPRRPRRAGHVLRRPDRHRSVPWPGSWVRARCTTTTLRPDRSPAPTCCSAARSPGPLGFQLRRARTSAWAAPEAAAPGSPSAVGTPRRTSPEDSAPTTEVTPSTTCSSSATERPRRSTPCPGRPAVGRPPRPGSRSADAPRRRRPRR